MSSPRAFFTKSMESRIGIPRTSSGSATIIATPLVTSARFAKAIACTDCRWLRTARRSRIATRATPGAISRNRGRMVPVYGTMRESIRPNSHRPPGSGARRDQASRSARPGDRDRCAMPNRDEEGTPICERAERWTSVLALIALVSHLLARPPALAVRARPLARHPDDEVAHDASRVLFPSPRHPPTDPDCLARRTAGRTGAGDDWDRPWDHRGFERCTGRGSDRLAPQRRDEFRADAPDERAWVLRRHPAPAWRLYHDGAGPRIRRGAAGRNCRPVRRERRPAHDTAGSRGGARHGLGHGRGASRRSHPDGGRHAHLPRGARRTA